MRKSRDSSLMAQVKLVISVNCRMDVLACKMQTQKGLFSKANSSL